MLIEGFGDEVIFFVVAAIVAVVFMILAWKSTEVNDQSVTAATNTTSVAFTVTQVVLQTRTTAVDQNHVTAASTPSASPATAPTLLVESPQEESLLPLNPDVILSHQTNGRVSGTGCQISSPAPQDQAEAEATSSNNEHDEKEINAVLELMDDELSAQQTEEGDAAVSECPLRRRNPETATEPKPKETITIRLKYMDDTQRVVDSPPSTTISDFKRLHFQSDLAAGKVIKLIYNGQVLSDAATLSELGLDNNCVVHCLVHQARRPANPSDVINNREQENAQIAGQQHHQLHHFFTGSFHRRAEDIGDPMAQQHLGNNHQGNAAAADAGIDISGLLVPLFGVILGLVWYCRIAYAAHFTATATLSLVGLSGLCLFSFLALRYPGVLDS